MIKLNKFYITTPLYYVNGVPHIGHAYATIVADILARWHRLKGEEVFFLTGTDEHGSKAEKAAEEAGKTPKEFVDQIVWKFIEAWKLLNISYDDFLRTTEERHEEGFKKFIQKIFEKGDIYKGNYEGWYCIPCETFFTEFQLVEDKCPDCNREVKKLKEEAYFFKLSKYQEKILDLFEKNKKFVMPRGKRKEMLNRVEAGLKDLCISRTTVKWGIPLPFDGSHYSYVWVEALSNYITALGYPNGERFKKFWPANVHLVGKEINWFHSVIWPALLMSAGVKPPEMVFVHGWWTVNGEKMSKSKGNFVDPVSTVEKYGVDAFRFFLVREMDLGSDGDYSEEALATRLNTELADDLGNLVNRILVMAEKYFNGAVPPESEDKELSKLALGVVKKVDKHMSNFKLNEALREIWILVGEANKYINKKKPWEIKDRKKQGEIIYNLLESLRFIGTLLYPFISSSSEKIFEQLGIEKQKLEDLKWGNLKSTTVKKGEILFRKLEREN